MSAHSEALKNVDLFNNVSEEELTRLSSIMSEQDVRKDGLAGLAINDSLELAKRPSEYVPVDAKFHGSPPCRKALPYTPIGSWEQDDQVEDRSKGRTKAWTRVGRVVASVNSRCGQPGGRTWGSGGGHGVDAL